MKRRGRPKNTTPEPVVQILDEETVCTICYAEFLDSDDLKLHTVQVHLNEGSRPRYCEFCSIIYPDIEAYALHLRDNHLSNLESCKYCSRVFIDFSKRLEHERKHITSKINIFSCGNCNYLFDDVACLQEHDYKSHRDSNDGVVIQECKALLSSMININVNTFFQLAKDNQSLNCCVCKFETLDRDIYIQHCRQSSCRSRVCDVCVSVFSTRQRLLTHVKSRCRKNAKVLRCNKCNMDINVKIYKIHKQNCFVLKCNTCDSVFNAVTELTAHQLEYHSTSLLLKTCKYCQRQYAGDEALEKHINRSHLPTLHLYKYVCIYCDKIFQHPKYLFAHFYTKHKDIEPYTCNICDKMFKFRKKFSLHIKLEHKSVGSVVFDKNFHVSFNPKKISDNTESEVSIDEVSLRNNDKNDSHQTIDKKCHVKNKDDGQLVEEEREINETPKSVSNINDNKNSNIKNNLLIKATKRKKNLSQIHKLGLKRKPLTTKSKKIASDSDNEPLIEKKQRLLKNEPLLKAKTKQIKLRKQLTCKICKKYCYTYQNYQYHMSLHQRKKRRCIKCSQAFNSEEQLKAHIANNHSTSQLTETLKSLIEKRKQGIMPKPTMESMSLKFRRTIKKANLSTSPTTATLTLAENEDSVKKFLENFTPDVNEPNNVNISDAVTICQVATVAKPPLIKMTKYKEFNIPSKVKLRMPMPFKSSGMKEKQRVIIKIVQDPFQIKKPRMLFTEHREDTKYKITEELEEYAVDYSQHDDTEPIPEVAEEILLEVTEETPKSSIPKIVLPDLPDELNKVRIGHLQPKAPFYKIVKIADVIKDKNKKETPEKGDQEIKLPDGTKLVTVNPLAHLMRNVPSEKVMEMYKRKYYRPKVTNFEQLVAKALFSKDTLEKKQKTTKSKNTSKVTTEK